MARNNQGLTGRQAKFLNTLAQGKMTTEQVERHLGLACYTLRRWMDEKPFMEAWAKTNTLLVLRRGADDAILGNPAEGEGAANAPSPAAINTALKTVMEEHSTKGGGDSASEGPRRARAAPPPPQPKSDRDLIRLRHGEEAARAFEELLRRHAAPASNAPFGPAPVPTPGMTDLPPPSCGPSL